ncbi:flavin reductase family protein [Paenibacillus methanolicus]|uniref:Flavin reductase (DIM6/NTAB) family NADH-FMN oxidoreductase RutF n=1 Tax=Paenibacillus methanolicus TaxID=582686 RepID=A0A5S5C6C8_9BACL|nr:flavin reductase family protein [Paenibacillus methanolicus]TYP74032.1 flavin reductase (DIM6/NTAB) family NADH-FMN oxidoreductase RutF [Paenibacillus methanolicus]
MHTVIEPKILYFGTSIVLISTLNPDGTPNLAPMSSAWWLNRSCMLGMSGKSQTVRNLLRHGECVLNLPSVDLIPAIDRLTLLTGSDPVPASKAERGYRYEADKFGIAGLTPTASHAVAPPRVLECPVQLEAKLVRAHPFEQPSSLVALEVAIVRVHAETSILSAQGSSYIDPAKWKPMIMNFCEYFGLGDQLSTSRLAPVFGPAASLPASSAPADSNS